jgi:hypothetical protein
VPKRKKNPRATTRAKKKNMPAARKRAKPRASRAQARRRSAPVEQPSPEHQQAYVETLIQTGEAAHLTKDGKLPAGATHKIVETDDGQIKVVRRRFSIA